MALTLSVAPKAPTVAGSGILGMPGSTPQTAAQNAQTQLGVFDLSQYDPSKVTAAQQYKAYGNNNQVAPVYGVLDGAAYRKTTSDLTALDKQIGILQSYQGTSKFDPNALARAQAQRVQLNDTLIRNELALSGGQAQNAGAQKILDLVQKRDSDFQQFMQANGGSVDWTAFSSDPTKAQAVLDQFATYQQTVASKAKDQAAQDQAQKDMTAAIDAATGEAQNQADKVAGQLKEAASLVSDPLLNFDQQVASTLQGLGTQGQLASRSAGFDDAAAATGDAQARVSTQAVGDRAAVEKEGMQAADTFLAQVYDDASKYQFDAQNLSVEGQKQVQAASLARLSQAISADINTHGEQAKGQLQQLQNLIEQYQNDKTAQAQKKALFRQILQIGVGALMAGSGAVLSATGAGAAVGAPLIAGGGKAIAGGVSG